MSSINGASVITRNALAEWTEIGLLIGLLVIL